MVVGCYDSGSMLQGNWAQPLAALAAFADDVLEQTSCDIAALGTTMYLLYENENAD